MNKCFNCSGDVKDYFQINSKEFCSVNCFYDADKSLGQRLIEGLEEAVKYEKGEINLKTTKRYKAKQKTQKQKGLQSKKSKQKKGKK